MSKILGISADLLEEINRHREQQDGEPPTLGKTLRISSDLLEEINHHREQQDGEPPTLGAWFRDAARQKLDAAEECAGSESGVRSPEKPVPTGGDSAGHKNGSPCTETGRCTTEEQ